MENVPYAIFTCRANSHHFQERVVSLAERVKIGRSVGRTRPADNNLVFDCKVLSRNHALLWYDNGKFFLKDTKSSNGTFANNRRLSKGSEESPPNEVNSGDIVQFGVDVIENSRRVTHGCIVSQIRLFLPSGEEAKKSESTLNPSLLDKEALHREQMLEQKLAFLQRLVTGMQESSEKSWQALIDEDKLLSRLEFLENQLHLHDGKNTSEDEHKTMVLKLQEEKQNYEATSNEAMRKALQEKLDAQRKLSALERTFSNTEDECTHLRITQKNTEQELLDLSNKFQKTTDSFNELKQRKIEEDEALKNKVNDLESRISTLQEEKTNLENLLVENKKESVQSEIIEPEKCEVEIKSDENENITEIKSDMTHQINDNIPPLKGDNELLLKSDLPNGDVGNHILLTSETLHGNVCEDENEPITNEIGVQTDFIMSEVESQTNMIKFCDQHSNTDHHEPLHNIEMEKKLKEQIETLQKEIACKKDIIITNAETLKETNDNLNRETEEKNRLLLEVESRENLRLSEMNILSSILSELQLTTNQEPQESNNESVEDMCKTLHEINQYIKDQQNVEKEEVGQSSLTPEDIDIKIPFDVESHHKELQSQNSSIEEQFKFIEDLFTKCKEYNELKSEEKFKKLRNDFDQHHRSFESLKSDSILDRIERNNKDNSATNSDLENEIKISLKTSQKLYTDVLNLRLDIVTCFFNLKEMKLNNALAQKDSEHNDNMESLMKQIQTHKENLAIQSGQVTLTHQQLASYIVVVFVAFMALYFLR